MEHNGDTHVGPKVRFVWLRGRGPASSGRQALPSLASSTAAGIWRRATSQAPRTMPRRTLLDIASSPAVPARRRARSRDNGICGVQAGARATCICTSAQRRRSSPAIGTRVRGTMGDRERLLVGPRPQCGAVPPAVMRFAICTIKFAAHLGSIVGTGVLCPCSPVGQGKLAR